MMMLSLGADSRPADRRSEGFSRAGRGTLGQEQSAPDLLLCPRLMNRYRVDN